MRCCVIWLNFPRFSPTSVSARSFTPSFADSRATASRWARRRSICLIRQRSTSPRFGVRSIQYRVVSRCSRSTLLLRSEDASLTQRAQTLWIVSAWLAFSYSLLIKPQTAAVLVFLLVAFAFVDPQRRRERVTATSIGILAGLLLALTARRTIPPCQSDRGLRLALPALQRRRKRLRL